MISFVHRKASSIRRPLHAPLPLDRVEPSPYFPSSRRWITPLALRIEDLPGATEVPDLAELAVAGRRLDDTVLVERDMVWDLKRRALEALWDARGPDLRFARWREDMGDELEAYARFCALAEHHGRGWHTWPEEHRHPGGDLRGGTA